jgi:hypothetical protein
LVRADNPSSHVLLLGFSAASVLLFGFIAWKPYQWALLTPLKPCSVEKLAMIYRWIAIIVFVGVFVNLLVLTK